MASPPCALATLDRGAAASMATADEAVTFEAVYAREHHATPRQWSVGGLS